MIQISLPKDAPFNDDSEKAHYFNKSHQSMIDIRVQIAKLENLKFEETLWRSFKNYLWQTQGHKCCYCERVVPSEGEGDVEHFRPKRKARDIENSAILLEYGYWWLAYDWKNFLFVCRTCNIQKLNRFPLLNEKDRVTKENSAVFDDNGVYGKEEPMLINPRFEDAESFFIYDTQKAHKPGRVYISPCVEDENKFIRSKSTIKIMDLNRSSRVNVRRLRDTLVSDRAALFIKLHSDIVLLRKLEYVYESAITNYAGRPDETSRRAIHSIEESIDKQKEKIASYSKSSSQFAGMCRYYLKTENLEHLILN